MPGPASKPFAQAKLSTAFLRVPEGDWAAIVNGHKREFRSSGRVVTQVWRLQCPTPVAAYTVAGPPSHRQHRGPRVLVLEKTWREPVGAISPESLELEGYSDIRFFRRYYMERTGRPFRPLAEVQVYRVRPWEPEDREALGVALLERLYGRYL